MQGQAALLTAGTDSLAWEWLGLELMRIAALPVNWDGEGAETIDYRAVLNAAFVLVLARVAVDHAGLIQYPLPQAVQYPPNRPYYRHSIEAPGRRPSW